MQIKRLLSLRRGISANQNGSCGRTLQRFGFTEQLDYLCENDGNMSDIEKIQLFENKKVRTVWVEDEDKWYFVLEDVIEVLTESTDPKQYVKRMKLRDP